MERDVPEEHARAWATLENVMEAEAIEAGITGDRVLRHLENLHPKAGTSPSTTPAKAVLDLGRKKRQVRGA